MSQAKVFDPQRHVINLGEIRFQGFAPGDDAITWEYDEDGFVESEPGFDGEFAWSFNSNERATVTLRLQATSLTNQELDAAYTADRLAAKAGLGGAGIRPFNWQDLGGSTLLGAAQARIVKAPNGGVGKTAGVREWKIRCASLAGTHGGNPVPNGG